jgi:hypothetical protein
MRRSVFRLQSGAILTSNLDLHFPDGRNFRSQPLPVSFEAVLALNEERLPLLVADPRFESDRKRTKAREPFSLGEED